MGFYLSDVDCDEPASAALAYGTEYRPQTKTKREKIFSFPNFHINRIIALQCTDSLECTCAK